MLTKREIQILIKILDAEKSVRTKDLSAEFHVSTRTIKSDLKNIRSWCQKHHIHFYSQPNKGYWIECNENERLRIYKMLMEIENQSLFPDQNDRIDKILIFFLSNNGYITASQLSNYLLISRNTIINDLKCLEDVIKPWMIQLERKPRIGYRLVGEEIHMRLLFEHIIQKNLSSFEIYQIITHIKSDQGKEKELNIAIFQQYLPKIEIIIRNLRMILLEESQNTISSQELFSIFTRLLIFLIRMDCECTIGSYRLLKHNQHLQSVSSIFLFKVMRNICEELDFPLLEDEFLYVHRNFLLEEKEMNLLGITKQLIQYVSEKEQIPYHKDTKLFNNLLAHLSLRFEKNTTYITELNPFNNEIKNKYSSLFNSIKEASEKLFGINSNMIEDSFISYIALHFLVSYEKWFEKRMKVSALYVCSTGKGVARLVKNRVEREIGNINITKYCSVMEVDEISKSKEVDLIISVIPINTEIPIVIVEPVPTEDNINAIRDKVYEILQNKKIEGHVSVSNDEIEPSVATEYEMISQEIIIKGFEIFYELIDRLGERITDERKKGLHVHLFFMLHRYYFQKQYDQFIYQSIQANEELIKQIKKVLDRHHIYVNNSELMALLQYFSIMEGKIYEQYPINQRESH